MMTTATIHAARAALALTAVASIAGCVTRAPSAPPMMTDRYAAIVAAPERSAADRATDVRRKPAQLLAFIGVRPGMKVLDLSAARGYTSELLARAVGPAGTVYAQNAPRLSSRMPPPQAEGRAVPPPASPPGAAPTLAERAQRLPTIVPVQRVFEEPAPPEVADGGLDLVTIMFNYHDLGHMGVDRARMNRAVFRALKHGGHFVIADHAGRPGTGISEAGTLHRVEEDFVKREVEAAGFRLAAEGTFMRNPADPRDRNTPEPPMPKDEFVLKFVKP
jgi:predicted methyltransferase